jgi:hypothetical protein
MMMSADFSTRKMVGVWDDTMALISIIRPHLMSSLWQWMNLSVRMGRTNVASKRGKESDGDRWLRTQHTPSLADATSLEVLSTLFDKKGNGEYPHGT